MTKEAKVGLLLGLVFIVAIAVILRGVHQEDTQTPPLDPVSAAAGDTPVGDAAINETVQRLATPSLSRSAPTVSPAPAAPAPETRRTTMPAPVVPDEPETSGPIIAQHNPAADPGVRYVQELPSLSARQPVEAPAGEGTMEEAVQRALARITEPVRTESQANRESMFDELRGRPEVPQVPTAPQAAPTELYVVKAGDNLSKVALAVYGREEGAKLDRIEAIYQANRDILSSPDQLRVGQTLRIPRGGMPATTAAPVPVVSAPASSASSGGDAYVVQEGDDLSSIALRVYGPVEGKRWTNVQHIFEANRDVLDSIDRVLAGQRLRIPTLGGRGANAAAGAGATGKSGRHVVREGDSLWKIAERHLGDGNRYGEIVRANRQRLGDREQIHPGMELVLPNR